MMTGYTQDKHYTAKNHRKMLRENIYFCQTFIAKVGKYFPFLIIKILILKKLQIFTQHFPMIFPVY